MKKNKVTKIIAFFALFWIIIWIIGTGLLIIFSNTSSEVPQELTQEQIQQLINSQSGGIITESGSIDTSTETQ